MSFHKKFQPNLSDRLADHTQHRYECVVLLYRYRFPWVSVCFFVTEKRQNGRTDRVNIFRGTSQVT